MTQLQVHLCAPGITELPAYLVLTQKGYAVSLPGHEIDAFLLRYHVVEGGK